MTDRSVVFDYDSAFENTYHSDLDIEGRFATVSKDSCMLTDMRELYYLCLRTAYIQVKGEDGFDEKNLQDWRDLCWRQAAELTLVHNATGSAHVPNWMKYFKIASMFGDQDWVPNLQNIEIRVVMDATLKARVISDSLLLVSPFLRTSQLHNNLALLNQVTNDFKLMEHTKMLDFSVPNSFREEARKNFVNKDMFFLTESAELGEAERAHVTISTLPVEVGELARAMMPYSLFTNDYISVASLPQVGTFSQDTAVKALKMTLIQMQFVIYHELAHIQLGHFTRSKKNREERLELELEADQFAWEMLTDCYKDNYDYVWIAIRWLFRMQSNDEVIGCLRRGLDVDKHLYENLDYTQRRSRYANTRYPNSLDAGESLYCERGITNLIQLNHEVRKRGSPFVLRVSDVLSNQQQSFDRNDEANSKWWEELEINEK